MNATFNAAQCLQRWCCWKPMQVQVQVQLASVTK
jgi:hypothetical protein